MRSIKWIWGDVLHLVGADRQVEIRPGWNLRCHPSAYTFSYQAQQTDPEQISEFDSFIHHCQPGMRLIDVGAHFGLFSLAALRYGGPNAQAIAIDPSPVAIKMVQLQGKLNNVSDRLQTIQAAAGNNLGWQDMVATGANSAGYYVAPGADHISSEKTRTECVTLDELVRRFGHKPTHVKIDVEGFEADVLRGGRDTLSVPEAPLLFLELHNQLCRDRSVDPQDTLEILDSLGYDCCGLTGELLDRTTLLAHPLIRFICKKRGAG